LISRIKRSQTALNLSDQFNKQESVKVDMIQVHRYLKPKSINRAFTRTSVRAYSEASSQYQIKDNSIIFSGIQPTGIPHLGNYFGALDLWTRLQNNHSDKSKLIFSIVDLHSITLPQNPVELKESIQEMATLILSCGIDPEKSVLYRQSAVSAHSQLCWILSTISPYGNLQRMTQWKSKLEQLQLQDSKATLDLGLYTYPVLQAADILLYK
jgi:tryptophanyl-tRNA synthetase